MNKRNRAQASSLFLLELTLAILFFSIASAVCVQIFVKSRSMSLQAQELNAAVREVSSAAEIIRASKDRTEAEELIRSFYGDSVIWTETAGEESLPIVFYVSYDNSFSLCASAAEPGAYEMQIALSASEGMLTADLTYRKSDDRAEAVYEQQILHYTGGDRAHASNE